MCTDLCSRVMCTDICATHVYRHQCKPVCGHEHRLVCGHVCGRVSHTVGELFLDEFSAHADGERRGGETESEGGIGKFSARRVFRHLQIDTGPRPSPSACSEILGKKTRIPLESSCRGRRDECRHVYTGATDMPLSDAETSRRLEPAPARESIFGGLSAHADGDRRGLDRIGGRRWKGSR